MDSWIGIDYKISCILLGGDRSDRADWVSCYDDVGCLLFVVSLADYDMTIDEEGVARNKMKEALTVLEHYSEALI